MFAPPASVSVAPVPIAYRAAQCRLHMERRESAFSLRNTPLTRTKTLGLWGSRVETKKEELILSTIKRQQYLSRDVNESGSKQALKRSMKPFPTPSAFFSCLRGARGVAKNPPLCCWMSVAPSPLPISTVALTWSNGKMDRILVEWVLSEYLTETPSHTSNYLHRKMRKWELSARKKWPFIPMFGPLTCWRLIKLSPTWWSPEIN